MSLNLNEIAATMNENNKNSISLRDYFAAKILPVLIGESGEVDITVKAAYIWADAMIEARNER